MHLGFHYHIPALKVDNQIFVPAYLGVFLDSLAVRITTLHLFMHYPLESEKLRMDYAIEADNVVFYDLGPHDIMLKRWWRQKTLISQYKSIIDKLDAFLIRIPTPMLRHFASIIPSKKLFLLKVGDYSETYRNMVAPLWKKSIVGAWTPIYQMEERNAISKASALFSNSQAYLDMFPKIPNRDVIKTTTLSEDSFYEKIDFNILSRRINLLYAGRIDFGKGLIEMIEALKLLINDNIDAVLNLVGWEEKPDEPVKARLLQVATDLGIADKVIFHGKKKLGPELFDMYRSSDVYLLASKAEGFPRTIWEAMASSLPVVTTRIGAIPFYLTTRENAILIDSGTPTAIYNGIKELLDNEELRITIIKNGYTLAKSNTLEKQAEHLLDKIKQYQYS